MEQLDRFLMALLDDWRNVAGLAAGAVAMVLLIAYWRYVRIVIKSLARSPLRTLLTSVATMLFVFVVTLIWSLLWLLNLVTMEKSKDFKALVTERWQLPSQMPMSYAVTLAEGSARKPGDVKPLDHMTWSFFGGTTDERRTRDSLVFFFGMEPRKILTMMDGLESLTPDERAELEKAIDRMEKDVRCVIIGKDKLKALNKKVGERISVVSVNYQGINLDDCEIVGTFPEGRRYDQNAVMHRDRILNALDAYERKNGKKHPLAEKCLNLVGLKVADSEMYNQVARQITDSPLYKSPAVKVETWSSGVASFLDAYRDLLFGMRWVLVPALLITMALVIANAIGISVRERRTEMAVLKVLGFGPNTILGMVLGEAVLIGALAGFLSAGLTWYFVNHVMGGIKFQIGFFPDFNIPNAALWWGPLLGGLTALAGSLWAAWSARSVRVSDVFAKVT